jgi:hypothetical protein
MSLDLKHDYEDLPLPSDITLRTPVYRRQGIIASLAAAIVTMSVNRRLRQISHRFRSNGAPDIPDYLREDIGLPPNAPAFKQWWDVKWD